MANFKIQNVRIQLKHDTAANWADSNLIPLSGELCLDTTNNVIKIGDGEHKFSGLPNAGSVITNASAYDATNNPGGIDAEHGGIKVNGTDINVYTLNKAATNALGGILSAGDIPNTGAGEVGKVYVNTSTGAAYVEYVSYADELKTARNISINENGTYAGGQDVVATGVAFKGNQNIDLAAALTTTGVTANTGAGAAPYVAVKVDAKGRVTAGTVAADFKATDSALGLVQGHTVSNNAEENQDKVFVDADGKLSIQEASKAAKLTTARTISASGDATGSVSFDGTANVDIALTLADTTTAGEKAIVTVDSKGRVTNSRAAVTSDISDAVAATTGNSAAAKVIKTDAAGELDDSFLKATGVTANTAAGDAPYTAVKVDAKGRVVAGTSAASTIAKNKDTDSTDGHAAQLGFVQSDYDDNLDTNADGNKGKVAIDASGNMTVTRVDESDKLHTPRTITFAAHPAGANPDKDPAIPTDATGTLKFDGSQNVTTQLELVDKFNVGAGNTTKRVVVANVDAKGRVVSDEDLISADVKDAIATSAGSGDAAKVVKTNTNGLVDDTFLTNITTQTSDATSTATSVIASVTPDTKGRVIAATTMNVTSTSSGTSDAGKLVQLNGAGKLDDTIIPALAISETTVVANIAARDALTNVQVGDIAVVEDASADTTNFPAASFPNGAGPATYIVSAVTTTGEPAVTTITWTLLKTPTSAVTSVNGKIGTVVLTTSDIAEGTNLYYTSARATTDANKVVAGGFYLLDCGGASGENAAVVNAKTFIDPTTGENAVTP